MSRNFSCGRVRSDCGAVLAELALVFPLQLLVTMGIVQMGLLCVGHRIVQYAAFSAARAALVAEPNEQMSDATRAAQIVCATIAGRSSRGSPSDRAEIPGWGKEALNRFPFSVEKTRLKSLTVSPTTSSKAGEVTAEIEHDFELVVPVVNLVFAFGADFLNITGGAPSKDEARNRRVSERYGAVHLPIVKSYKMVRPW